MTLKRSALFMPANNLRAILKAKTLACDAIILDLEDSIAPDKKVQARHSAKKEITEKGFAPRELAIRVNGLGTPWHKEDLAAFVSNSLNALVIPKAESPEEIRLLGDYMNQIGYPEQVRLWLMAETPLGVLNINALCQAHPRISTIFMGTSDLAKCLRVRQTPNRDGLVQALSTCVLAARAANLDILDGVCLDFTDSKLFESQCIQGKTLGFDGKTLIHPSQIEICNQVFAPTEEDVARSQEIVLAFQEAQLKGEGLCALNGTLIENLHLEEAKQILKLAETIQARLL